MAPWWPTGLSTFLAANPDTELSISIPACGHAYVAQVLADRGIEPGNLSMGGFDIVAAVNRRMKGRLHPGAGRPAALHAGLFVGHGGLPS